MKTEKKRKNVDFQRISFYNKDKQIQNNINKAKYILKCRRKKDVFRI
jgi:hypothetical protein